jgi:hypothetical protein
LQQIFSPHDTTFMLHAFLPETSSLRNDQDPQSNLHHKDALN